MTRIGRIVRWGLVALCLVLGPGAPSRADVSPGGAAPPPQAAENPESIQARLQEVVAKAIPCTVGIQVGPAQGSGVIVSEDGYVLTAGHVAGKPKQKVKFFFADGKTAAGESLGVYTNADAGMMKITDPGKWPHVEMGKSYLLPPGNWCVALGHPLGIQQGRPPVVRVGRLLRSRDVFLQTDCPLVGGDSGGPLFDLSGKVIGIHSRIGGSADMNLHVPIDVFRAYWDRLRAGESWEDKVTGRNSTEVKSIFRPLVAEAARATARVRCRGRDVALATVVAPDGVLATKASQLEGKAVCRLADGRQFDATVVDTDPQQDLALLKIDATDLPVVAWTTSDPAVGQWLVSSGTGEEPLGVGVLSVPRRRIAPTSGVLGVVLADTDGPARIEKVLPGSPAQQVGLKTDDVITHLNGAPIKDRSELVAAIRKLRVGDVVRLTVERGQRTLAVPARLGTPPTAEAKQREFQNRMGVELSRRHDDFPAVLQHDAILKPEDCGGPVVDLSGKVAGINIARGGRTETYVLPGDLIRGRVEQWRAGQQAATAPRGEATTSTPSPDGSATQSQDEALSGAASNSDGPNDAPAEKSHPQEATPNDKTPEEKAPENLWEEGSPEHKSPQKKASERAPADNQSPEGTPSDRAAPESAPRDENAPENPPPAE